jgi:hypothetical protein
MEHDSPHVGCIENLNDYASSVIVKLTLLSSERMCAVSEDSSQYISKVRWLSLTTHNTQLMQHADHGRGVLVE